MSQDQAKPRDRFDVVEDARKEREAAARDLGHILFGPPASPPREDAGSEAGKGKESPAGFASADAGERGMEPEEHKSPGEALFEHFLDIGVYKDR